MPDVSVIMAVRDGEAFLRESVASILRQTLSDFEFIIVDDGSTDRTAELLRKCVNMDKRVKVLRNETNHGLPAALNRALDIATGRHLARHDADDIAMPWRLEVQTEFLDRHRDYFLTGGNAIEIDAAGRPLGIRPRPVGERQVRDALQNKGINPVIHPSIMFRCEPALRYREHFVYAQDYDFLLRAVSRGLRLFNLPQILLHYRAASGSTDIRKGVRQFMYRQAALRFYQERAAKGVDSYEDYDFRPIESVNLNEAADSKVLEEVFRSRFGMDARGIEVRRNWQRLSPGFRRSPAGLTRWGASFLPRGIRLRLRKMKVSLTRLRASRAKGPAVAVLSSTGSGLAHWRKIGTLERETLIWRKLAARGWQVSFYTYDTERLPAPELGLTIHRALPFRIPGRLLPAYCRIRPWLDYKSGREQAVIVTNQAHAGWPAIVMGKVWKAKVVARCGYVLARNGAVGLPPRRLAALVQQERWTHLNAELSVVPTQELKNWSVEHFGLSVDRIRVIPNCVDTVTFRPDDTCPKDIDVLCVGRLAEEKRHGLLLQALAGIPALRVVFVGKGPLESRLKTVAADAGLELECVGQITNSELPRYYHRAKVFVLCSAWEGHPKALVEAMACACACVGTKSSGIENMLAHGQTGWLTEGTPEALRAGIVELLDNATLRTGLGRAANSVAVREFSLDRIVRDYEAALVEVLSGEGRNE